MLTKTLFIGVLLNSILLFSQESVNGKFRLGFIASSDYNYQKAKSSEDFFILDYINDKSVAKIGFTVGANSIYQLSKSFSLEFGAMYSNKGAKEIYGPLRAADDEVTLMVN